MVRLSLRPSGTNPPLFTKVNSLTLQLSNLQTEHDTLQSKHTNQGSKSKGSSDALLEMLTKELQEERTKNAELNARCRPLSPPRATLLGPDG
jgi:hypothetical protein